MKESLCIEFETVCDGKTINIPDEISGKLKGKVRIIAIADSGEKTEMPKERKADISLNSQNSFSAAPLERNDIYERD